MKPFIGITTNFTGQDAQLCISLRETYCNEIRRAGGVPVLLPLDIKSEDIGEYTARVDGILFSGGADLSTHLFNEDPIWELNSVSSVRDATELALMEAARHLKLPVLGICRGCQTVNVALGGTLIQDIARQIPNSIGHYPKDTPSCEPYHNVTILDGESRIAAIIKQPGIRTNSFHHQAVKQLAPGLRVTAQTSDGIVEAYESADPSWFVHCVQFHPEAMSEKHPEFRGFFTDFVMACRNRIKT